jgi:hypothetical protein
MTVTKSLENSIESISASLPLGCTLTITGTSTNAELNAAIEDVLRFWVEGIIVSAPGIFGEDLDAVNDSVTRLIHAFGEIKP